MTKILREGRLQWSRGPKTPDTILPGMDHPPAEIASMEPGSEDPGYAILLVSLADKLGLQWSRGPKTPDTRKILRDELKAFFDASMEPGSEDPGYLGSSLR